MKGNRIASFDGLRGIAVLNVVLFHCFYMLSSTHYFGQNIMANISKYGWLGVDLFFIISGFVISFTLYKYNNVKSFCVARFARLYPTYWAAIIFAAILCFAQYRHIDLSQYLINFLMFQGLLHLSNVSGVFWTLSFELTFYTIAAVMFYFGFFKKNKVFVFWGMITLAWELMNYFGAVHPHSILSKLGYLLVLQYSPLFMFGIFLHKSFSDGWHRQNILMLLFLAAIFIALFPVNSAQGYSVNMCRIFMVGIFMLCSYATYFPKDKYLSSRFLVFFGKISYSWYLIHLILAHFIFDLSLKQHIPIPAFSSFILSMIVAILFNKYIENPSHNFVIQIFNLRGNKDEAGLKMA